MVAGLALPDQKPSDVNNGTENSISGIRCCGTC